MLQLLYRMALSAIVTLALAVPSYAQDKVRIISSNDSLLYDPIYAAEAMGYFTENGIELDRLHSTSGPNAISALLAGDVEMVMGVPSSPMLAKNAGGDIKMIAGLAVQYGVNVAITQKWADWHHITKDSSYQQRLAALKGITIGVTGPGGGNDQLVSYLADQAGLDRSRDMNVVALGDGPTLLAAYSQGKVDAISISAPHSNVAPAQFGGLLLFNTATGDVEPLKGFFGAAVSARGEWLDENQDVARRFVKSLQMGIDAMHDPNRTEQVKTAVRELVFPKLDQELFTQIWNDAIQGTPKSVRMTDAMLKDLVDFGNRFSKNKLDESVIAISYTNEFAPES